MAFIAFFTTFELFAIYQQAKLVVFYKTYNILAVKISFFATNWLFPFIFL